jgi:hypothetical protein
MKIICEISWTLTSKKFGKTQTAVSAVSIEENRTVFMKCMLYQLHVLHTSERLTQTHYVTGDELVANCMDLFSAGTETTSSTLAYALRYMVQYPSIQDEMRQELHRVIGTERLPGMDDIAKQVAEPKGFKRFYFFVFSICLGNKKLCRNISNYYGKGSLRTRDPVADH